MAKRKVQQAAADGPTSQKPIAKLASADLPAGADFPTPAAQAEPARKPQDSAKKASKDAGNSSEPPAAGTATPAADTPALPKHKKRRKSGEPPAADAPAQQRTAGKQRAGNDGASALATAAGGMASRIAAGCAVADGGATQDPLSPDALQVMLHPVLGSFCGLWIITIWSCSSLNFTICEMMVMIITCGMNLQQLSA